MKSRSEYVMKKYSTKCMHANIHLTKMKFAFYVSSLIICNVPITQDSIHLHWTLFLGTRVGFSRKVRTFLGTRDSILLYSTLFSEHSSRRSSLVRRDAPLVESGGGAGLPVRTAHWATFVSREQINCYKLGF